MSAPAIATVHATAVSIAGRGVLIIGSSGAGKSSLALGVLTSPFLEDGQIVDACLISDDQVVLERIDGRLYGSPPPTIAGKLEVRGLGILPFRHARLARMTLVVELKPVPQIDRLPDPAVRHTVLDVDLPIVAIDPTAPGAAARVYLAGLRLDQD